MLSIDSNLETLLDALDEDPKQHAAIAAVVGDHPGAQQFKGPLYPLLPLYLTTHPLASLQVTWALGKGVPDPVVFVLGTPRVHVIRVVERSRAILALNRWCEDAANILIDRSIADDLGMPLPGAVPAVYSDGELTTIIPA
jgi:hypothetical protein